MRARVTAGWRLPHLDVWRLGGGQLSRKLPKSGREPATSMCLNPRVEAPGWWREPARLSGFSAFLVSHNALPSNSGLRGLHRLATKAHIPPLFIYSGSCLCSPLQRAGLRLPGGASAASEPRISAAPVTWQQHRGTRNFNFCCDMWRMEGPRRTRTVCQISINPPRGRILFFS